MRQFLLKMVHNPIVRYVFFGGLTTLVNFVTFYLLTEPLKWDVNISNIISVALSILFAYFVNARFVFHSPARGLRGRLPEFCKFVGARLFTMAVEVGGVFLMADLLSINAMISKLSTQIIVLILNYLISKLIVFIGGKPPKDDPENGKPQGMV